MLCRSSKLIGVVFAFSLCAHSYAMTPPSVLDVTDPDLRFWVAAEDLVTAGLADGDPINQWVDRSSYGTIMAPRTNTFLGGPYLGDPVEEAPHLELVDINGVMRPAARFDAVGLEFDANLERDRLYQTNNLDDPNTPQVEFDPLDIGNGDDLNMFAVYFPEHTHSENPTTSIEFQIIVAKRGPNESVYEMGINTGTGRLINVQYDANVSYVSGERISDSEKKWNVTFGEMLEGGDDDTVEIWHDASESPTGTLQNLGVRNAVGPDGIIENRNNTVPEPLGLGAHSQTCCGELESFEGKIAEVIIFARELTAQEFADVDAYLHQKWFGAMPEPDREPDGDVDGQDFLLAQEFNPELIPVVLAAYPSVLSSLSAVPEPAAIVLAAWAALAQVALLRRQRNIGRPTC